MLFKNFCNLIYFLLEFFPLFILPTIIEKDTFSKANRRLTRTKLNGSTHSSIKYCCKSKDNTELSNRSEPKWEAAMQ